MKFRYLFFILFFFVSIQLLSQQKYSKVRIYTDKAGMHELQKNGIDLGNAGGKPGVFIETELSEYEIYKISAYGFKYEVLIKDLSKFYAERYAASVKKNNNSLKGINYVTPEHFNYGSMGGFLTLDEVYAELDEMHSVYPNLITAKFTIGNTQTVEGRDMYAVKISDNPDLNEDEPEVLYTSLIHAREPESMQQLIWFMWYLLENYGTDDEISYLVDNLQLYFIPVVNPDGYEYNHQTDPNGGGMWRKNKRDNDNNGTFSENYDGVDLNRNFAFQWGYDDSGSSPDPGSNTYRGTSAFSEPVTQNIRDFTNQHNFLLAHNHHTYSDLILFPWSYETIHSPDDDVFRNYAQLMASENAYGIGQSWEILYAVNGDANDWMYGEQTSKPKIFAYTQETGSSSDGFWPSQDRIIPLCEESYLSNLYLARFAAPYAELTDNSPEYIPRSGYLKFNLKRMGLSGNGDYTVSIVSDNAVFQSLGNSKNISLANVLDEHSDSISYTLSNDIQYGDEFSYTVTVSSGTYTFSKSFTKSYYNTEIIIEDNGDDTGNWTTSGWEVTGESYHSPNYSITDSQGSEYANNENNAVTLNSQVDLTNIQNPKLNFWAKWSIENNWDYVQLLISTDNGANWIPLQTAHTNPGEGSFQPTGEPLYDGSSNWIEENIDLSSYTGQFVKFRFELHSDGSITYDGFYFDDFKIITVSDELSASISSEAGCGENSGKVTVYSTKNGNQTFYLRDGSGNPVNDWTGNASFHIFDNLPDGTYQGQVEKDGEISPLSDAVELIHISDLPTVPTSTEVSDTEVCVGTNVILSYTGGSGSDFVWYAGSCGDVLIGNGNNFLVTINSDTTFFGRWENACGVSDCRQVSVSILPGINIISQPQSVNASPGEDVSFSVVAEGDNLTYQWRKNNTEISGATEATYSINNVQVSDDGEYSVVVSGTCGSITSNTATLDVSSGISNIFSGTIEIYPNPSSGSFTVKIPKVNEKTIIKITDVSGKLVYISSVNKNKFKINLQNISEGLYFMKIITDKTTYIKEIIIR